MTEFLTPFLIFITNFIWFPFFALIQNLNHDWSYILAAGVFFSIITTISLSLPLWLLCNKLLKLSFTRTRIALVSFLTSAWVFNAIIYFFTDFGEMASWWPGIWGELWVAVLVYSVPAIALTIALLYFFGFRKSPKQPAPKYALLTAGITALAYPATIIGYIILTFLLSNGGWYCQDSYRLYESSGYDAHTQDLCLERANKSECPKNEGELKAFRPEVYEELQVCYRPYTDEYGTRLVEKAMSFDIF